jgi:S-adenosylmethionine:tRNA ribosyltransferase-isomerase
MQTTDFDYQLPPECIAQRPAEPRDSARLMVLDRHTGQVEDSVFNRLPQYLRPKDVLVLNETFWWKGGSREFGKPLWAEGA